jgi:hypothetical protein
MLLILSFLVWVISVFLELGISRSAAPALPTFSKVSKEIFAYPNLLGTKRLGCWLVGSKEIFLFWVVVMV